VSVALHKLWLTFLKKCGKFNTPSKSIIIIYLRKIFSECDFVVQQNNKIDFVIQVCKSLDNEKIKKREVNGLIQILTNMTLQKIEISIFTINM
jgi:hypothetical protein